MCQITNRELEIKRKNQIEKNCCMFDGVKTVLTVILTTTESIHLTAIARGAVSTFLPQLNTICLFSVISFTEPILIQVKAVLIA
jgi:hypothetical protein